MIESIGIRNLGVIESAQLQLSSGFTALTGETGAGKTVVLNALGLLIGARADSGQVRTGQAQLFVEGSWRISDPTLTQQVIDCGGVIEDQVLIVNRSVSTDGKSRAALGGAAVPAGTLASISEALVTVHGQSDQQRLRSASAQRDALDEYGGEPVLSAKAAFSQSFEAFRELRLRLERMQSKSGQDQVRVQELRMLVREIEELAPEPNELEVIEEALNRLSNVEQLQLTAARAHELLSSEDGPTGLMLMGQASKTLETSSDPQLRKMGEELAEVVSIGSEISARLSSYLLDLEADPAQLEALQARKQALVALERRSGKTISTLTEELPQYHDELLDLDSSDDQLEKLEIQLAALESQAYAAAAVLGKARSSAAESLSAEVLRELGQLAMSGIRFSISVTQGEILEASGLDRVEFLIANPGSEPRSLAKGASGGELSRLMLAIELVLVANRPLPTMIFDEVDAGVGGQAALELGKRLKKLAEKTQVIVVTHLPQVAALADHQIQVAKDSEGGITSSSVRELSGDERITEIARMLSGNPDSAAALLHARELLNL